MSAWLDAVTVLAERTWAARVEWVLIGEAAATLHGVPGEPKRVTALVRSPFSAATLAGHLQDLAVADPTGSDTVTFLSSRAKPLLVTATQSGVETLGRWLVDGVPVEVSHVAGPDDGHLVETGGRRLWEVRHDVATQGLTVPVIPLEVLVASSFVANDADHRTAWAGLLRARGANEALLAEALRGRGFTPASIAADAALLALLPPGLRPPGHRAS